MANKKFWLGILLILAVFGVCVPGCSTMPMTSQTNYYNLGDVSEENCALIQVSPVQSIVDTKNQKLFESDYLYSDLVKIDGQGDKKLWQKAPSGLVGVPNVIVRVTPGVHTFTITFFYDDDYEVPLDITYDCKAGKGYKFDFLVQNQSVLGTLAAGFRNHTDEKGFFPPVITNIIINEANVNEKGNFGGFTTSEKEVGKKTETLHFHPDMKPNNRERLVKRVP